MREPPAECGILGNLVRYPTYLKDQPMLGQSFVFGAHRRTLHEKVQLNIIMASLHC